MEFVDRIREMGAEVADFHARWPQLARLPAPLAEVAGETAVLLDEEVQELRAELDAGQLDMEAACEEAADVLFVAMGLLCRLGQPGALAMERVTAKNRGKTEATHHYDAARRKVVRRPA